MAPDGQGKVIGNFLICEPEQAFPEAGEIQVFTGEHSSANLRLYEPLHQELVARGLTTAASPRRPSRPIGKSSVHRMLTNPYYKGSVRYQGVTYAGVHEAIVPNEVWDQVQTVLGTHRSAADATQVHEHYLKGTVFCGQCGSRLLVCNAKSSQGTIYPYLGLPGVVAPHTDRVIPERPLKRRRRQLLLRVRHHDRGIDIQHDRLSEIGPGDLRSQNPASGCQLGPHVAPDPGPGRGDLPPPGVGDLIQRTPHRRSRRDRPQDLPLVAQDVDVGDRLAAVGE